VPEFNNENLNEKAMHLFMGAGHKPVDASGIDAALEKRIESVVRHIQGGRYTYDDATVVVAVDWDHVEPTCVFKPEPVPVSSPEPEPVPVAEPEPVADFVPVPVPEPEPVPIADPVPQAELDPKPAGPEIASSINISLDPDMPDPEATVVLSAEGGTDVPALEPIAMLENMLGICFEYDELLEACQAFVKKHDEGARSDGGQRDVPINTDPTYE